MADFRRAFVIVRLARCLSKIRWHVRDKRSMVYTRMVLAGCLVQVRHAGEDCPEMRIDLVRGRRKEWLGLLTVVGRSVSAQFRGIQHCHTIPFLAISVTLHILRTPTSFNFIE